MSLGSFGDHKMDEKLLDPELIPSQRPGKNQNVLSRGMYNPPDPQIIPSNNFFQIIFCQG